jgi:hypothetical protein
MGQQEGGSEYEMVTWIKEANGTKKCFIDEISWDQMIVSQSLTNNPDRWINKHGHLSLNKSLPYAKEGHRVSHE